MYCPYCDSHVRVDTEERYSEDELYEAECDTCEKKFGFRLSISYNYYEEKVDCWNGDEHKWKNRVSAPRHYSEGKQACYDCGEEREIPKNEWEKIEADHSHAQNWRS